LIALLIAPLSSDAGQKGHGPQKTTGPKQSTPKGQSVKANKPVASAAGATKTTGGGKPTGAGAGKATGAGKGVNAANTTSGGSTTTSGKGQKSPTASTDFVATNDVAAKAMTKQKLMDRLATRFPDVDLNLLTADFKNFGQFNAALHVSENLGIPFADLKAAMTGTTMEGLATGESKLSLGQAIKELRPGADADAEVQLATKQAATLDTPASLDTTQTTATAKRPKSTQSASR
jgi:hypothetical protein